MINFETPNPEIPVVLVKIGRDLVGIIEPSPLTITTNDFAKSFIDWRFFTTQRVQLSSLVKSEFNQLITLAKIKDNISKKITMDVIASHRVNSYVICFETKYGLTYYAAIDRDSGCPYLTANLIMAEIYNKKGSEIKDLDKMLSYDFNSGLSLGDEIISRSIKKVALNDIGIL